MWKYFNPYTEWLYNWHSNGVLTSKGPTKLGKPHGMWEIWAPNGDKMMNQVYENGALKKLFNFNIYHPDEQRPPGIPPGAKWDIKHKAWVFLDFANSKLFMWYMNGEKMSEARISNGKIDGKYIQWYEDGKLLEEGNYENGMQVGLWISKDRNENLKFKAFYRYNREVWLHDYTKTPPRGLPIGIAWHKQLGGWTYIKDDKQIIFYDNGDIRYEIEIKGNDYHGKFLCRYKGGKISIEGQYGYSLKQGKWMLYNLDGSLYGVFTYKDGKEIEKNYFNKKNKDEN